MARTSVNGALQVEARNEGCATKKITYGPIKILVKRLVRRACKNHQANIEKWAKAKYATPIQESGGPMYMLYAEQLPFKTAIPHAIYF
eukprot:5914080-Amphidinium_carterae.1